MRFLATLMVLTLFISSIVIFPAFGGQASEEMTQAKREGRADGSADTNMFGCGMGGFFLGPLGWLHAVFAQRKLETQRVLYLQDKSGAYHEFYTQAYKESKKNSCLMYSLGGSVVWVLFLFY